MTLQKNVIMDQNVKISQYVQSIVIVVELEMVSVECVMVMDVPIVVD